MAIYYQGAIFYAVRVRLFVDERGVLAATTEAKFKSNRDNIELSIYHWMAYPLAIILLTHLVLVSILILYKANKAA